MLHYHRAGGSFLDIPEIVDEDLYFGEEISYIGAFLHLQIGEVGSDGEISGAVLHVEFLSQILLAYLGA